MSEQVEIPDIDDLPDIIENAEFAPVVKLLTTETPVLGYDGYNINPANWQAQALANRTQWLRERLLNISTRLVLSVNGKTGSVVVTYADVGADAAGTADALMTAHLTALDPHSQYFNETRGDARYVQRSLANQSNGWLQLDAAGKIPAAMLQTLASRYVVVANQASRLALASSANLTICAQADIDQLFYLNGGANPSVAANWVAGQSATVSGVSSVYGRTGAVLAQAGDYDADKITETATRKFVSPDEKTAWNAKQATLVSGTNIRSLFGTSLLGSGNLAPTPAQMGSAATVHAHTTADITDYTQKTQQLITASLEAGTGVTLGYNPISGKTIISAIGGSGGHSGYIVVDRPGATAGQNHSFSISVQNGFNLAAYALKEEAGSTGVTVVADEFTATSEANYATTDALVFDGTLHPYTGGAFDTSLSGDFYRADVKSGGKSLIIMPDTPTVVPVMTSNTAPAGYTASVSEAAPGYSAYIAFDGSANVGVNPDCWSTNSTWLPTEARPHWLRIDMPEAKSIIGYSITNRAQNQLGNPKSWTLQGSADNGVTWIDIHQVANDENNTAGAVRDFYLLSIATYKSYRLLITAKNGTFAFTTVAEFKLLGLSEKYVILSGGKYYGVTSGTLSEIASPLTIEKINTNGMNSVINIDTTDVRFSTGISIISSHQVRGKTRYLPFPQIAVNSSLNSASAWSQINAATLTATQTGNGKARIAVTRNLVSWTVLRSGAWVDIGSLSGNAASAVKLLADGMTPADFGAITAAQWTQFFSANNGVPDVIAFAFALDITDPSADAAAIDRLLLNVNNTSSWKVQTATEVEIRWRNDNVSFKTVTAGNYKLAYQIP